VRHDVSVAQKPIYVEIDISAPVDRVWELTQDPAAHSRWDLRFSRITHTDAAADGAQRFIYERSLGVHTIRGTGISAGEREHSSGSRTSALRFTTADRLSPLRDGRGYWRYVPTETGTTFITGYDYAPGWGSLLDRLVLRRFIGWMTAWSFDRLRIWAETGVEPERWPPASALMFWRAARPRAGRTIRHRRGGEVMAAAPSSLNRLAAP
jgi:hypothetical protein